MSVNKLRWKSRKGIRELDILLQNYLETHYSTLDSLDKKLFEEILEIDTYDLLNAISGKSSYNEKYKSIITELSKLSTLKNGKK
jgi:antitoxin CptB|tara:strand:+ start:231 stop:482 length:252 start_codon:yes stop_codon:yes gene_type:complete